MSDHLTPWDGLEDGLFDFLVRGNFPGHWPHYGRLEVTITATWALSRANRFPFQAADPAWPSSGTPEFAEVVETETYDATLADTLAWTRTARPDEIALTAIGEPISDSEFHLFLSLDGGPGDLEGHLWHHLRTGPGDPINTTVTQVTYTRDYSSTTSTAPVSHTETADLELRYRPDEMGLAELGTDEWIAALHDPRGADPDLGLIVTTDLPAPLPLPDIDYSALRDTLPTPPAGNPITVAQDITLATTALDVTEGEWYGTRRLAITLTLSTS